MTDEGLVVDLDLDSWNRADRRKLQDQFGRAFAELVEFVNDGFFRKPILADVDGKREVYRLPVPEPIEGVGNVGQPVKHYPDDVLIAMLAIELRRAESAADVSVLEEMGEKELRAAVRRGNEGKATPPES